MHTVAQESGRRKLRLEIAHQPEFHYVSVRCTGWTNEDGQEQHQEEEQPGERSALGEARGLALEEDAADDFSTHPGGAGDQRRPGVGRTPQLSQQQQQQQQQQQKKKHKQKQQQKKQHKETAQAKADKAQAKAAAKQQQEHPEQQQHQQQQQHQHQHQGLPEHVGVRSGTQFTCFTMTKVQTLTQHVGGAVSGAFSTGQARPDAAERLCSRWCTFVLVKQVHLST